MKFPFSQVDVFTRTPLKGNALAVVHDADGLTAEQMQAFARWTNLSETTFLLRPTTPEADYRVRIFAPNREFPFAGHPTLGSCHAWRAAGGVSRTPGLVVQECGVGLVRIRVDGEEAAFAAPPMKATPVDDTLLGKVRDALGLSAEHVRASSWLDNGLPWLVLQLDSAARVLAVDPDFAALAPLADVGLVGAHAPGGDVQFELRGFAPGGGIPEDPVTGSLNASVAGWLMDRGEAPSAYRAAQGARVGRDGRVSLTRDGDTLWVGGPTVGCIRGDVSF